MQCSLVHEGLPNVSNNINNNENNIRINIHIYIKLRSHVLNFTPRNINEIIKIKCTSDKKNIKYNLTFIPQIL